MSKKITHLIGMLMAIFLLPLISLAQNSITGHVYSTTDGSPVAGVSVVIKSTKIGVSTSIDGAFSIHAKTGDILIVSGIGVTTQEVTVGAENDIIIKAVINARNLNEVVVTALGVKKEYKRLGYAVQQVKGEDLIKARDPNPITGLAGKVAGLSVAPSAELLRAPNVLLRGSPLSLYIVDGFPISSDTWNISPDDIETYTILKGPSAAALYGSRAQNGAILITTKKGASAKRRGFTVEFNTSNSIDKGYLTFPHKQTLYGPGESERYFFQDGTGANGLDGDYDVLGPYFNGQLIQQYDSPVDPVTGIRKGTPWLARGKNNLKDFLRTGFQTTDNLSLSAAGDNYNMRFSLSHSYQASQYPNTQLNITNFNLYGSYNPTRDLKIEANLNYNRQYTPNYPDVNYGPNSVLYNIVWTGADWNINDMKNYWQPGKVGVQSLFEEYKRYQNPWFMAHEWLRGHYKNDIYGYVSANYKLNANLNITGRTQVSTYDLMRNEKMPFSAHPYGRNQGLGDYREDRRDLFENNTEVLLNYNYNVASFINLSGVAGGNLRSFKYTSNYTSTDYLNVPNVYSFSNSRNPLLSNSFDADMRVLSGYFSLDASFSKYLTLSVTGRVDKTSALAPLNNSYFYPSVSASTVLSDYLNLPSAISFLKLRASYAQVRGGGTTSTIGQNLLFYRDIGNDQVLDPYTPSNVVVRNNPYNYQSPYDGPDYSLIPGYTISKPYNNMPATTYTTNVYDPSIKPFNRVSYEQGVDVKFLHNRLGLSATAFQYINGPQILANPISLASGFSNYYVNALKTKTTGYELSLTGTPIRDLNGFSWDVMVNWSTFKQVYKELPPGQQVYNTFYKVGDRVDKFYGTGFLHAPDGEIVYDGSGKPLSFFDASHPKYLGNFNADYNWSINNKVSYKSFSLGFQFDGSVGGVITDYFHAKSIAGGSSQETVEGAIGAARYKDWQNTVTPDPNYNGSYVGSGVVIANGGAPIYDPQTGTVTNIKGLTFAPNTTKTFIDGYLGRVGGAQEYNLMSKTFAKLREVTLTYNLPPTLLAKTFISKASVSFIARNLIYFYKDNRFKDVDVDQYNYTPTANNPSNSAIYGSTDLQSPSTRRYGININLVF